MEDIAAALHAEGFKNSKGLWPADDPNQTARILYRNGIWPLSEKQCVKTKADKGAGAGGHGAAFVKAKKQPEKQPGGASSSASSPDGSDGTRGNPQAVEELDGEEDEEEPPSVVDEEEEEEDEAEDEGEEEDDEEDA